MLLTPLATTEDLRRWDAESIALGLPEFTLMENAARAALNILQKDILQKEILQKNIPTLAGRRVLLFMGGGNNGGDAACLARHLHDAGADVRVLHTKALGKLTGAARQHARLAKACGVIFCRLPAKPETALARLDSAWQRPDIIVDGLLGTGFIGNLRPPMPYLIQYINTCGARGTFIFALDVPSGLNSMTGRPCPDSANNAYAVRAHATVTFAAATPGLVLPEAWQYTGTLHICDIGIPRTVREAVPPSYFVLDARCAALLPGTPYTADTLYTPYTPFALHTPLTPHGAHKNCFGHALVIGGATGMTGAAHLATRAALRAGAGLVTVAAPAASIYSISAHLPEAMTIACGTDSWPDSIDEVLHTAIAKATVLIIGPGMGMAKGKDWILRFAQNDGVGAGEGKGKGEFVSNQLELLVNILRLPGRPPVVCDADALNILAAAPGLLALLREDDICTPHPAEAARLLMTKTAAVQKDRFAALRTLCDIAPCVFVLKGAGTLIGHGRGPVYIAPWDIPTLAVAGSGDVLAGCMGALYARGLPACKAAVLAVATHARAGMLCARRFPVRGVLASEIADALPEALDRLD